MGFHKSSMNIHLRDNHVLCAYCKHPSGDATYSELDLDHILGTRKGKTRSRVPRPSIPKQPRLTGLGKLAWSAENLSRSASVVSLEQEGPMHEPILHAQLNDGDGPHEDTVNLADCIKNEDGQLKYMGCF
jgi:hypothetical protein